MLRDHGPPSRDLLCALLVLRTFMDANGYASPSMREWARTARMSTNTLTKHYKAALREGWLGVDANPEGGRAWKRHSYRAAVPADLELTEKDEKLSVALVEQCGEIDETPLEEGMPTDSTCITLSETPRASPDAETCLTHDETASTSTRLTQSETPSVVTVTSPLRHVVTQRVSNEPSRRLKNGGEVSQITPQGVSKVSHDIGSNSMNNNETPCEALEALEAIEALKTEGRASTTCLARDPIPKSKEEDDEETRARIRKALADPTLRTFCDDAVAKIAHASIDEVRALRAAQA
jgi:hypothetical protein